MIAWTIRLLAVGLLTLVADAEEVEKAVLRGLIETASKSPDVSSRRRAVYELAGLAKNEPEAMAAVVAAFSDASREVREEALICVEPLGDKAKDAVPVLEKILRTTTDDSTRGMAAVALASIDPQSAPLRKYLTKLIIGGKGTRVRPLASEEARRNRRQACRVIAEMGHQGSWAIPLLLQVVQASAKRLDDQSDSFAEAVEALSEVSTDEKPVRRVLENLKRGVGLQGSAGAIEQAIKEVDTCLKTLESADEPSTTEPAPLADSEPESGKQKR